MACGVISIRRELLWRETSGIWTSPSDRAWYIVRACRLPAQKVEREIDFFADSGRVPAEERAHLRGVGLQFVWRPAGFITPRSGDQHQVGKALRHLMLDGSSDPGALVEPL